ncbi:class I SAM-dependent methyltransferase [Micrococcus sp. HMSC067E09]|uniref:class I SAM-dependent methyltransferase n=1 Tax=Micrococcus sp. HMSC067E09 TaxID=1739367 RepID=UPI000AB407C8
MILPNDGPPPAAGHLASDRGGDAAAGAGGTGDAPAVPSLPGRAAITRTHGVNPFDVTAEEGEHYDAVRPSYPSAAVDWILAGLEAPLDVVDLGAGTGLFTRLLASRPVDEVRSVAAVEPSEAMRAVLARDVADGVRVAEGTAERTHLAGASADVVVAAQAWHWVDVAAASAEAARVLRPGGRLAAVWNQLDVTVPWVHRLTRIMHAGDVHAAAPERRRFAAPFGPEEHARWPWQTVMTPAQLHGLMASRSYWLRSDDRIRARMRANLDWYLHEHLGHAADAQLTVPYVTVAWRARATRRR